MQLVDEWLGYLIRVRNLATRTCEEYERDVRQFARRAPDVPLELRTTEQLRSYFLTLEGSPSTVARKMAGITSFYRYLVKTGRLAADPTAPLDRPRVNRRVPRPIRDFPERLAKLPAPLNLIATFLYETGL
ncbi:MAG: site-specific integrase, partial [Actinomycetota bacterium]